MTMGEEEAQSIVERAGEESGDMDTLVDKIERTLKNEP